MGRKKNHESEILDAGANQALCPNMHALQRMEADADYECDACSSDIMNGVCYYGCAPCDYSICNGCYIKLLTNTMEGQTAMKLQQQRQAAENMMALAHGMVPPSEKIDDDVMELCEHYGIEDRITKKLNEAMNLRHGTFVEDMEKLWEDLANSRSPPGLLMTRIKSMSEGTFVGKKKVPKELKDVIEKYRLDNDARSKLTDYILKQNWEEKGRRELEEVALRLEHCGKPSAICMTCVVKLFRGQPLPAVQVSASHRDYAPLQRSGGVKGDDKGGKGGGKDRGGKGGDGKGGYGGKGGGGGYERRDDRRDDRDDRDRRGDRRDGGDRRDDGDRRDRRDDRGRSRSRRR